MRDLAHRRWLWPVAAVLLLVAVAWVVRTFALAPDRPNIIVIMTDDQRWDSLKLMPVVKRQLAARGVTFANAFATTPLCCPARASFLSGRYAHHHGVWENKPPEGGFTRFRDEDTLPVWLQDAGYTTALMGKYLNGYRRQTYVPPGWDEWHAFTGGTYYNYRVNQNGSLVRYGAEPEDYATHVIQRQALRFISEHQGSRQPFFLLITPNNPHGDARSIDERASGLARPAPRDEQRCDAVKPHRPPSFNETDLSDKPASIRAKAPLTPADIAAIDEFHKSQACSLKAIDDLIDEVVAALDDRDRTAIVFLADNGHAYGEHRKNGKDCLYEECARIPLIISYPELTTRARTSQSLTTNLDVTATIADLAGAGPGAGIDGHSVTPTLRTPGARGRGEILLEIRDDATGGKDAAVRTSRYKYIARATGETELYDLRRDPFELANLSANRSDRGLVDDLSARLARLRAQ